VPKLERQNVPNFIKTQLKAQNLKLAYHMSDHGETFCRLPEVRHRKKIARYLLDVRQNYSLYVVLSTAWRTSE
jgi:hypothetical protein